VTIDRPESRPTPPKPENLLIANEFVGCGAHAGCLMNNPLMNAEVAKDHQSGISLANMIKLLISLPIQYGSVAAWQGCTEHVVQQV
jgi:hypothetical protein